MPSTQTAPVRSRPRDTRLVLPDWFADRFVAPNPYKSASGGRGASKSHNFAQLAVGRMAGLLTDWGYSDEPVRIASARQFQQSITESVKQVIEHYIRTLGLLDEFRILKHSIDHVNGSHMWFPGFDRNPESLRGTEGIDVLWIEEAHTLGDEMELIVPTVFRKDRSEIWFSWNPNGRNQWCWVRFVRRPRDGDVHQHVTYLHNPWFPKQLDRERLAMIEEDPDRYPHVWLGEPDDAGDGAKILPYQVLYDCVAAYEEGLAPQMEGHAVTYAGLDMAEGGKDKCALVVRHGPIVREVHRWPGVTGDVTVAAIKSWELCLPYDVIRIYYDASTPVATDLKRVGFKGVTPEWFGGEVKGKDLPYETSRPNGAVFARRNIQLADAVRQRANRTVRLLKAHRTGVEPSTPIRPERCLFIPPDLPRIDDILSDWSQPVRRTNPTTGKWEVHKAADDEDSPDRYDGLVLSFAQDSATGLTAR